MRHIITIQAETRTSDGGGGYTQTWTDYHEAYASVRPVSGAESYKQGQMSDTQLYEFVIRYETKRTITPAHRIKYGTRMFQVRTVINHEERNRYLIMRAEEKVAL